MTRLYTLILCLAAATLSLHATVKPRYQGWRSDYNFFAQPEELNNEVRHNGPRRIGLHDNAPLTSFGTPKVPVILVQFSDLFMISGLPEGQRCVTPEDHETVRAYYNLYCNGLGDGGHYEGAGSAAAISEYFRDQSDGLFQPEFHVIGPVTLANGYAYYGQNGDSKDSNISKFYQESVIAAMGLVSDWSQFDNNHDGIVDMVFFVFAGEGENAGAGTDYIWPKESPSGGTINNVKFGCYACCNETYNGKPDGIGVFVHELSHALGLPDMYDYNYKAYGLDYWDIMDSGCYCQNGYVPCGYSAYEKDFMGWKPLITLSPDEPQHLVVGPQHSGGQAYKMVNPQNPNEYYVLENRQNRGWDSFIGRGNNSFRSHGLLITHIDYEQSYWTNNRLNTNPLAHQRCTIVAADGQIDSYMNVGDIEGYNAFVTSVRGDPFPGIGNVTRWEGTEGIVMPYIDHTVLKSTTLPISYSGTELNQPLLNIVEQANGDIELDYCPGGKMPTGIETATVSHAVTAPVYSITGQQLGTVRMQGRQPQLGHLPPGIYIVQGRKYIVR